MPELDDLIGLDAFERDPREDHISATEDREVAARSARTVLGLMPYTTNLNQEVPPWLIEGLLQERAIHVISAAKGSCKTWLGLNLMLAGAHSSPILGHTSRPFNSIYVAADSPLWDIRQQLRKLIAGYQFPIDREGASFLAPLGFRLDSGEHMKILAEVARTWNIRAIFLDVLLYSHGADENSDREMSEIMKRVKYLRDNLGLAVVLLHHHAKTTKAARGADTILQASEHHYELRKKDGVILLNREKVRGEEDWTSLSFRLTAGPVGGKVLDLVTPTAPSTSIEDTLLSALSSGTLARSSLEVFADSSKQLDNALSRLRREGKITSPARGRWQLCQQKQNS